MTVPKKLFQLFASLKLAVTLIVSLGLALGAATFIESRTTAETARRLVYQSGWFSALLLLLALNVGCAAFSRWPWKRRHAGFVITHAGIILVLIGSLVTQGTGLEGQMALAEGESADYLLLDESIIEVRAVGLEQEEGSQGPVYFGPDRVRQGEPIEIGHDITVSVFERYRNAVSREEISPYGSIPNPAIQFTLKGSRALVSHWLFARDREAGSVQLGPAEVTFMEASSEEELDVLMADADTSDVSQGMLILKRSGEVARIPVGPNVGRTVPIGDGPYRVTLVRYLPHAVVEGATLVNQTDEPVNPACEIVIEGEGVSEQHTLFSRFPDFPTLHGRADTESLFEASFVMPPAGGASRNHMLIVRAPSGDLSYRISRGDVLVKRDRLIQGTEIETGWMDFVFTLNQYFPTAHLKRVFEPASAKENPTAYPPAVGLVLTRGRETTRFWLGRGTSETLFFAGHHIRFSFGLKRFPLDFSVRLEDFEIGRYRGTDDPASFASQVELADPDFAQPRAVRISMNQPMKHKGFTFFQASYQEEPGRPTVSVFAVTKDPGIPLKYGGSIILVTGITMMFFIRRYKSTPKEVIDDSR